MRNREPTLAERRETAAKAKQALLERARAKAPSNDPGFAARQEERRAIAAARLLLPDDVHVQAPPNLSPGVYQDLIGAGDNLLSAVRKLPPPERS